MLKGRGLYIWDGGRCLVFSGGLFGWLVGYGRYLSVLMDGMESWVVCYCCSIFFLTECKGSKRIGSSSLSTY